MTTYAWAQLPAGTYGLPGPAVVLSPWVLEVRVPRPRRRGFTRISGPQHWTRARPARKMIAAYGDPSDMLVVSAENPTAIDADGLRNLTPGAASAGDTHWRIGSTFRGPAVSDFHDQVHRAGRVLLLTGDLQAYWAASQTGGLASFAGLFPGGAWAAWVTVLGAGCARGLGATQR